MINYDTIKELINNSIRVTPGMITISPQFYDEGIVSVSHIISRFPGCFSINKATVAYVFGGKFYVTPYTRKVISTLKANNFVEATFFVPFSSNWEYPENEKPKWDLLRLKARKSYEQDFTNDCVSYSDKHHIGTISENALRNSLQMPNEGIEVTGNRYFPVISNFFLDCSAAQKIGTFCPRGGCVVFVYRDGHTYVTKGYQIITELRRAGFRENKRLFVPFCNGEEIRDSTLKKKWESLITRN